MTEPGEIDRIFIDLGTKLTKFKKEFASEMAQRVEARTPVLSGSLKAGWLTEQTKTGFTISNIREYAKFVEYGTVHMAPRAMLRTTMLEAAQIAEVARERAGIK